MNNSRVIIKIAQFSDHSVRRIVEVKPHARFDTELVAQRTMRIACHTYKYIPLLLAVLWLKKRH